MLWLSLALVCAWLTHRRASDWQNNRTLFLAAARVNPDSASTHWHLGLLAWDQGDKADARRQFRQARARLDALDQHHPLRTLIWIWTDLVGL